MAEWKEAMQLNLTIIVNNGNALIIRFVPAAHNIQCHRSQQESIQHATIIANLRQCSTG